MVLGNRDGRCEAGVSIGDGVEAAFGERMAAGEAAEREPRASEQAETDQRDVGVLRAGGQIEALRRAEGVQDGRDYGLVDAEGDADGELGGGVGHREPVVIVADCGGGDG